MIALRSSIDALELMPEGDPSRIFKYFRDVDAKVFDQTCVAVIAEAMTDERIKVRQVMAMVYAMRERYRAMLELPRWELHQGNPMFRRATKSSCARRGRGRRSTVSAGACSAA